jgi:septal ring factor EnvC (AmiA/AmiB activator)
MATPPPSRDPSGQPRFPEQGQVRARTIDEVQRELEDANITIRRLTRELKKERARLAETSEAYSKTVSNMVEIARENALLENELARLRRIRPLGSDTTLSLLSLDLTPSEARAIRKAMARLHHPDVGGDEKRMKEWNAVLDRIDEEV